MHTMKYCLDDEVSFSGGAARDIVEPGRFVEVAQCEEFRIGFALLLSVHLICFGTIENGHIWKSDLMLEVELETIQEVDIGFDVTEVICEGLVKACQV